MYVILWILLLLSFQTEAVIQTSSVLWWTANHTTHPIKQHELLVVRNSHTFKQLFFYGRIIFHMGNDSGMKYGSHPLGHNVHFLILD